MKPKPEGGIEKLFAQFGREVFRQAAERCVYQDMYESDQDLMELAAKIGLCRYEPYDPAVHGENAYLDYLEPGDMVFTWDPGLIKGEKES